MTEVNNEVVNTGIQQVTVEIEPQANGSENHHSESADPEVTIDVEVSQKEEKMEQSEDKTEAAEINSNTQLLPNAADDASKTNRFSDSFTTPPIVDATENGNVKEAEDGEEEDKIVVVKERAVDVPDGDGDKDKLLTDSSKKTKDGTMRRSGEKTKNTWEEFTPTPSAKPKDLRRLKSFESDTGGLCADDAANCSEWTALDDDTVRPDEDLSPGDGGDVPFRRFKSERVEKHRAARIIETLNTRRLSNTSLDLESRNANTSGASASIKNADSLRAPLSVGRGWDVYLKLDKRIPGNRTKWQPVNITIKDSSVVIRRSTSPEIASGKLEDNELIKEVYLHHNNTVSKSKLKHYDRNTKIHQIKLQVTTHTEKRTLKRFLFVEHVTHHNTIIKFGYSDLSVLESLSESLNEAIRQLPITRQAGVAYRMNEVFIDVKDSSDILMNCNGAVLDRSSCNKVYVQAFLTGQPECKLVINDLEGILRQGQGSLSASTARQVRLTNVILHPCVDENAFKTTREIRFHPVDGSPFELVRCSIEPYVSPPVNVCALMEYNEYQNHVHIKASFIVRKKLNLRLRPIKEFVIKFPIPASWSSLFVTEGRFGRSRSVRSTSALRGSFRHKVRSQNCRIEVHIGNARYEPEHNAVMWRIGHYTRSSQPHTFTCDIDLKSGMHRPDPNSEHAEVSYTIPGSSTGLAVRAFKVQTQVPEKWVKYEILYHYRVQMFQDLSID